MKHIRTHILRRGSRRLSFVLCAACVAFGLGIALAARNGVEHDFDTVVDSIGRNLYHIVGPQERVIEGTTKREPVPFTQADVDRLAASRGIAAVAGHTAGFMRDTRAYGLVSALGVTANYFTVHRVEMHAGRPFEDDERGVCVLSYEFAEAAFPGEDPVGRMFDANAMVLVGEHPDPAPTGLRVVGVLAPLPETPEEQLFSGVRLTHVYLPVADQCALLESALWEFDFDECASTPYARLAVRVDMDEPRLGLESIIAVLGEKVQLRSISTLYGFTFRERRRIVGLYSLAAGALLFVGTVSALAMSLTAVAGQVQAIAIHRALGAPRAAPGRRVLLELAGHMIAGIVLGAACAWRLAPMFSRLLSVTLRLGPLHAAGAALLLAVAMLGGLLPAIRASRVPPLRAIRALPSRSERSPLRGFSWLVIAASVIGIAAVVFAAALSDSLESALRDLYGDAEPNVVAVTGGIASLGQTSFAPPYALSAQDVEAIQALPSVSAVSLEIPVVMSEALYGGEPIMGNLYRLKPLGDPFFAGRLVAGRLPTDGEMEAGRPVALVGSFVAERELDGESPIGQTLVIGQREFEIVGVFDTPKLTISGATPGWKVILPIEALDDVGQTPSLAWVKMNPTYDVEETVAAIRRLLAERHPDAAPAQVEGPATEMGRMIAVANGITFGLQHLSFVTLVISAFALASLCWAQAARRQRRISLERALGASIWQAFWMTFRTALAMTFVAGVVALGIGVGGTWLVRGWFSYWKDFRIDPTWALWAFGSALAAAAVGGGIPSLWAARLSPMEGIRRGRLAQ